ncbi:MULTISPECIES: DUF6221 family protein [unclassified Micromonospora]|uniref:DUF6221 family protein n=1 Tax=unclassified Micromonospora TaxID=2617518 RepID=UPI003324B456
MDELIPWLHHVLNTRERVARAAAAEWPGEWQALTDQVANRSSDLDAVADHMQAHSPELTLREVAADRRILAEYERLLFRDPLRVGPAWDARRDTWETAVRMRAEAYADQPGYREVWRPCPTT